jgi:hypothetical protein
MKLDNASRWGTLFAAMLGISFLVACGGGGGGGDGSAGPSQSPPQNVPAPDSIGGTTYTFYFGVEGTRAITFNEDNVTWVETREGQPIVGTYRYNRINNGNTAELVVIEDSVETSVSLTFNASNSGAFAFADQSRSGTFETRSNDPDDPGNEPPPNEGLAPASLAGRTMLGTRTFTTTGPVGQTHVYTFSVNTFHDSDPPEESDGGYIYQPAGNNARLTLNYFSPQSFNGDKHELQMTFHTGDAGVFESIYTRRDGTVIRINGTFELE